jgi:hypothetical protein
MPLRALQVVHFQVCMPDSGRSEATKNLQKDTSARITVPHVMVELNATQRTAGRTAPVADGCCCYGYCCYGCYGCYACLPCRLLTSR